MANENGKKCLNSVFEPGNVSVKSFIVKKSDVSRPPSEVLVLAPEAEGCYPTLLFCHGYCTLPTWYSQLLQHISSHGYIIIAPQFYEWLLISMEDEVKIASKVIDWLSTKDLPQNVHPDLSRLSLMGHSRGGKVAFALALSSPSIHIQALVGLDPVSGPSPPTWVEPNILSHIPHSFDLSVPIAVIGTGLSNRKRGGVLPPLAPDGYNHSEFFNESRPPCAYFLARDYGHCDVLNDSKVGLGSLVCRSGKGCKDKMRRSVGGLVVAFLKAHLGGGDDSHLHTIVDAPAIAPIVLDPVIYITK